MSEIKQLHAPFAKFLRDRGIEFIRARSDRASTIEKGWPDFTVIQPRTGPLLIEFKAAKGKVTRDQVAVCCRLDAKGFVVHIVRELEVAIELFQAWRLEAPMPIKTCELLHVTIRKRGDRGDWLWNGVQWIRRAIIADYAEHQRGPDSV